MCPVVENKIYLLNLSCREKKKRNRLSQMSQV